MDSLEGGKAAGSDVWLFIGVDSGDVLGGVAEFDEPGAPAFSWLEVSLESEGVLFDSFAGAPGAAEDLLASVGLVVFAGSISLMFFAFFVSFAFFISFVRISLVREVSLISPVSNAANAAVVTNAQRKTEIVGAK